MKNCTCNVGPAGEIYDVAVLAHKPNCPLSSSYEPILVCFSTVPEPTTNLRAIWEPFAMLAHAIVDDLPANSERTEALRLLIQARDAAVRSMIMGPQDG